MTEELSISEINSLWDKVSARMVSDEQAQERPPAVQHADPLYEMLRVEGDMALRYEQLCRRLGNKKAASLAARLYEKQFGLVRRMAAMVFLRSGKRPDLRLVERQRGEIMGQLRDYTLWEISQVEAYKKYGFGAEQGLRDVLFEAQKRKKENVAILSGIIEELILR